MPHFIGIKLANCHKKTHFQSEQKKLNVISRLDWLLMGFGYFREISFTGKKFPIYMEPLTRGYWSTDMDRSHNQCILQHFRTRCKINLTYQSQNLRISKWSWSGKNGFKHHLSSISMALYGQLPGLCNLRLLIPEIERSSSMQQRSGSRKMRQQIK